MNRKYAVFGFLSPLTAFIFIAAAIHVHHFQFSGNALSDMGRVGLEKNYIFNSGLILSGIFGFIFSISLLNELKRHEKIPGSIFLIATVFLICIGIFPEGTDPHFFFSVMFYLFAALSIFIFGVSIISRDRKMGVFSIFIPIIGTILALGPHWDGVAIPETIGAFFISLWVILISHRLWRGKI